jgi:NAD(P)-dependent dehydrogenase (short-subunit alcohol dehydrogenase family)
VRRLVDRTVARFGRLDVAVNNAGTEGKPGPVTEQTAESYAATFHTNVIGTLLSMKHELRVMLPERHGSIVNVSSTYGPWAPRARHSTPPVSTPAKGLRGRQFSRQRSSVCALMSLLCWYVAAFGDEMGNRPLARRILGEDFVLSANPTGRSSRWKTAVVIAGYRCRWASRTVISFDAATTSSVRAVSV